MGDEYILDLQSQFMILLNQQECITVGCVPPAAVAIAWGVSPSVYAGMIPPPTV